MFVRWVISPLVIHLPVIALTFDTKRKQQNTAAEVIKVLHEKSLLEMTPDRVLQGHIYSGCHPGDITLSGALVQSPLALEDLSSEHYGTK